MAIIALFPWPEAGHGGVFARLASRLASNHRVQICSHIDVAEFYISRGFEFVPLCPETLGSGTYALLREKTARLSRERRRQKKEAWNTFFGMLGALTLPDILGKKPDFILVDTAWPYFSFIASRSGTPSAALSTALPLDWDATAPPASTTLVPRNTTRSRGMSRAAWTYVCYRKALLQVHDRLRGYHHETDYLAELARAARIPEEAIERRNSYGRPWTLNRTELVMCPKALEFPRANPDWRHYVEPCIDTSRLKPGAGGDVLAEIPSDRPLVYCAFGTQIGSYRGGPRFFRKLIETAGASPEWRFLIATGPTAPFCSASGLPENVTATNHAPQLRALQRASLMITHGGLASIKECIWSGVPMIVIPFYADQPGNAARVQYHGLGLQRRPERVEPMKLRVMIQTVLNDTRFASRVRAMQKVFRRMESELPSIGIIEHMMRRDVPDLAVMYGDLKAAGERSVSS